MSSSIGCRPASRLSPRSLRAAVLQSSRKALPMAQVRRNATASSSCSTGPSSALSPLRYHIFKEPLPYLIGLKLQHDIIDRRLRLKAKGQQTDDIVLLLGKSTLLLSIARHIASLKNRTYTNIYDRPSR
jgi:lipoyl(octanoyl) transferase